MMKGKDIFKRKEENKSWKCKNGDDDGKRKEKKRIIDEFVEKRKNEKSV